MPATTAASMWAAWVVVPHDSGRVLSQGFVVLLAGIANSAFTALVDTISELCRTREELARVAVAEERDRFSRDLHDLLGHTLSVMVVEAQAVRRLAGPTRPQRRRTPQTSSRSGGGRWSTCARRSTR